MVQEACQTQTHCLDIQDKRAWSCRHGYTAIGFWGVGSIVNFVEDGMTVQKGQYMGHFGYGGSSIILAFEPSIDLQFLVDGKVVQGTGRPRQVNAKQEHGCENSSKRPPSHNTYAIRSPSAQEGDPTAYVNTHYNEADLLTKVLPHGEKWVKFVRNLVHHIFGTYETKE